MGACGCENQQYRPQQNKRKFTSQKKQEAEDKVLRESINQIFKKFDANKDGVIQGREIEQFVRHSFERNDWQYDDQENQSVKGSKLSKMKSKGDDFYSDAAERLTRIAGDISKSKITKEQMFQFYKKKM